MKDESFKYMLHHPDGTKEQKIGNNFDVYSSLRDYIDKEINTAQCQIESLRVLIRSITSACIFSSIGVIILGVAIIIKAFK